MPKNKKKFISKDEGVTFQLVHRSQQDPLTADENAPQHVLKECARRKRKEEEQKYGIFFDDEYDYLQHLKSVTEPSTDWQPVTYKPNEKRKSKKKDETRLFLPSSVFQSEMEESVGLLNKAAPIYGPRPELDPDILAAMDDDFDYDNPDNILEENFMELANQSGSDLSGEYDSEMEDSLGNLSDGNKEETKSRFTDYSLTSSVIRRNENLMLLDSQFEKMFEKYDSQDIGCLDSEDIEGRISLEDQQNSEQLSRLVQELEMNQRAKEKEVIDDEVLKRKIIEAAENQEMFGEEMDAVVVNDPQEKWDCETIISTYSNIYNHPAKICEAKTSKIEINKKTGIPMNVLNESRLTARALARLDDSEIFAGSKSITSHVSELSIRPKNETPEERKFRKQNLREYRRERRLEKKANSLAFKDEKCRQEKILLNLKNNQHRIKMF